MSRAQRHVDRIIGGMVYAAICVIVIALLLPP
jgi:hypothetical protein